MKIIVDFQESRTCVFEYFTINTEVKKLKVGDFIISKDVCVERKTVNDFINSIIDKRLFKQVENIQKNYAKPIVIIEGDFRELNRNISPKVIQSAIISLILKNNIRFLYSSSARETAELLEILAKKEQEDSNKEIILRSKTKKMNLKEMQQFFLEGLPGVGPKLAKNLLKKFKSPEKVINASKEELQKVDKIGPKKARLIKKIIEKK